MEVNRVNHGSMSSMPRDIADDEESGTESVSKPGLRPPMSRQEFEKLLEQLREDEELREKLKEELEKIDQRAAERGEIETGDSSLSGDINARISPRLDRV